MISTIEFYRIFAAMSDRYKSWIILIFLALTWGSSFILIKKSMFTENGEAIFSDTQVGALRMVIAALVLSPIALKNFRKITDWKLFTFLAIVGLCGNFLPSFLFTYSETGISSGYAGMLNSCTPIFAIIIGSLVFKDKLNKLQITGVIIGTIGVVTLMIAGQNLSVSGDWSHIFAVILATFFYAISLNTIRHKLQKLKSFEITSLAFLIILIPSIIISINQGIIETIQTNPFALQGLTYLSILSIVGTSLAVILFNRLISMSSVLFASSVTYLIPIVAVIIGLFFNEPISVYQVLAMFVVISGILVANVLGRKKSL